MKIDKIASLIFIFMLSGCSSISAPTTTAIMQPSIEAFTASLSPVPTITAIPTVTQHAEEDLPEGCINLTPTTLDPSEINGLFTIKGGFFEPQTWQEIDIVDDGQQISTYYPVSPNKKYMLVSVSVNDDEYYYALKTPEKLSKIDLPIPDDWVFSWWSDNEHIVFYTLEPEEYLNSWNPFTGELKRTKLDLPNAIDEYFAPGRPLVRAYIDSKMEKVFYGNKDGRLVLWNIKTNKEVASLPKPIDEEGLSARAFFPVFGGWLPEEGKLVTPWPIWSGDRNPPANELYVFDIDGNISQLTELNQKYSFASAEDPSWSPDGHQVGFWVKIGDGYSDPRNLQQWLAIFDTNTNETKVYCLANGLREQHPFADINWSPDSQQVIVNIELQDNKKTSIFIDLKRQTQSEFDFNIGDWIAN